MSVAELRTTEAKLRTVIELVIWRDATSRCGAGWGETDEVVSESSTTLCQSVGWLKKETHESITLIAHLTDSGLCGGDITIPKGMVLTREVLSSD